MKMCACDEQIDNDLPPTTGRTKIRRDVFASLGGELFAMLVAGWECCVWTIDVGEGKEAAYGVGTVM